MGNGYTFELETLIFVLLSICACDEVGVSSKDVSVYGDDIIIPVEAYDVLKEVLETCGFTINEDKSYHEGPFRESCGEDYFRGINVRPFLVRENFHHLAAFSGWLITSAGIALCVMLLWVVMLVSNVLGKVYTSLSQASIAFAFPMVSATVDSSQSGTNPLPQLPPVLLDRTGVRGERNH
jgi:hypothetical protein